MKTILCVNDGIDLGQMTRVLLNPEDWMCEITSNAHEAIKLLEAKQYDVIITDFRMSEMDGADLLFWARENHFHTPFIFASKTSDLNEKETMALEDRSTTLIQIPLTHSRLQQALEVASERRKDFDSMRTSAIDFGQSKFKGQHTFVPLEN